MKKRGNLIVIEGPDGVGKSALAAAVVSSLCEAGLDCRAYAFPGNEPDTLGNLVYRLHHESRSLGVGEVAPVALQAAHIAAHLDAIDRVFRPNLNQGETIVLDRYWWSTFVYGTVRGISRDILESLISTEHLCWGDIQPLVIFMIDNNKPWRESEDTPNWHRIAQEYRNVAKREQNRSHVEVVNNHFEFKEVVSGMVTSLINIIR